MSHFVDVVLDVGPEGLSELAVNEEMFNVFDSLTVRAIRSVIDCSAV